MGVKGAGIAIKGLGKALKSFKQKRIDAINRKVEKAHPRSRGEVHRGYIEEYGEITSTKAKNKKEYKAEQKAKIKKIEKNLPKELP